MVYSPFVPFSSRIRSFLSGSFAVCLSVPVPISLDHPLLLLPLTSLFSHFLLPFSFFEICMYIRVASLLIAFPLYLSLHRITIPVVSTISVHPSSCFSPSVSTCLPFSLPSPTTYQPLLVSPNPRSLLAAHKLSIPLSFIYLPLVVVSFLFPFRFVASLSATFYHHLRVSHTPRLPSSFLSFLRPSFSPPSMYTDGFAHPRTPRQSHSYGL